MRLLDIVRRKVEIKKIYFLVFLETSLWVFSCWDFLKFSQQKVKKRRKFSSRKNSRIFRIEKKWKERECEGKTKSSSFLRKTDFISEQNFLKFFGGKKGKNIVAKWRNCECKNCETIRKQTRIKQSETYFFDHQLKDNQSSWI